MAQWLRWRGRCFPCVAENHQLGGAGEWSHGNHPKIRQRDSYWRWRRWAWGELVDGPTLHAGINKEKIVRQEEARKLEDNVWIVRVSSDSQHRPTENYLILRWLWLGHPLLSISKMHVPRCFVFFIWTNKIRRSKQGHTAFLCCVKSSMFVICDIQDPICIFTKISHHWLPHQCLIRMTSETRLNQLLLPSVVVVHYTFGLRLLDFP